MALAKVSYIGNGITTTFSLTFNYLNQSHVKAFVNGVESTDKTFATPSSITFPTAPPAGSIVVLQRITPTTPIVDFVDGSNLTEALLDTATRQAIYVAEENKDESTETISLDSATDSFRFLNKRLADVANPINTGDVVTKGYLDTTYLGAITTAVSSATASATSASNSASTATTQAGIATTQAGIATTKANEASASVTTIEGLLASLVKATQAQAEAGTDDTAYMTPLKTKQAIDALTNSLPAGTIIAYGGNETPSGYLVCPTAPTTVSRTTYSDLFSAIGTTWGAGDGSTTFGIPFFSPDYAPVQANGNLGTTTVGQVIAHTHTQRVNAPTGTGGLGSASPTNSATVQNWPNNLTTASTGGTANLPAGSRVRFLVKF